MAEKLDVPTLARRHLRFGWASLAAFAAFGLALEGMHAFKLRAYLDVTNEARRLLWTLAHAHGTLLSLVHVAFALTLPHLDRKPGPGPARISRCLFGASVLVPGGFFLGGFFLTGNDPGPGVLIVPLGAVLLIAAALLIVRATGRPGGS